MKDLVAAGQAHGVPIAAVLTPSQILGVRAFSGGGRDHRCRARARACAPACPPDISSSTGSAPGFRAPAPPAGPGPHRAGAANPRGALPRGQGRRLPVRRAADPRSGRHRRRRRAEPAVRRPGRRGHQGRKRRLPGRTAAGPRRRRDERVVRLDAPQSTSAFGVDLRSAEGKEIFGRLVAEADAVFANFKPGTLTAPGFSYETLHALNPRIVLAESSAFGDTGPWSTRMGYGPLVRATTGVTRLWTTRRSRRQPDNRRTTHGTRSTTRRRSFPITWSGGSPRSRRWPR